MSSNAQVRRRAVQAARGESPFDLLLVDAQIVDMATGEIRPADVGIVGEMIASVHPRGSRADAHQRHALDGAYLAPLRLLALEGRDRLVARGEVVAHAGKFFGTDGLQADLLERVVHGARDLHQMLGNDEGG